MRQLVHHVAVTLDRFIAGPPGRFDLFAVEGDFAAAPLADFPGTVPAPARGPLGIAGPAGRCFDRGRWT